ncbi:hypothetical protein McanMca71_000888 [Microsporum canis]
MSTSTKFPSTTLHILRTHSGPVNAVTFSSSPGTYLLTGSSDRSIHLSRALPQSSSTSPQITTSPIQKYEAHGYSVLDIAVSADNARFASVGGDKQVFLWDVETGSTIRRWSGHTGRVEAVAFGGEGDSVVISGSADSDVKIWDTRSLTSKPVQTLTEATDTVSSVYVHMPTSSIITASYDGRIRTYDLRMGEMRVDVMAHPVTSIQGSTDGKAMLASCLDGRIRMVDRDDGSVLKSFGDGNPSSASEKRKAPVYMNKELRIRSTFTKGDSVVLSGSETPDASFGRENAQATVVAWDVLTGNVIQTVSVGAGIKVVSCVTWNEKGSSWAGGCSDGTVKVYG